MTPAYEPLTLRRNADTVEEWHLLDSEGVPFNFTGYTDARMQLRLYGAQPGDPTVDLGLAANSLTEGVCIIETVGGVLGLRVTQATSQTAYDTLFGNNEAGSAVVVVYDIILTAPDGSLEPWFEGPVTIEPGVTIDG